VIIVNNIIDDLLSLDASRLSTVVGTVPCGQCQRFNSPDVVLTTAKTVDSIPTMIPGNVQVGVMDTR